VTAGRSNLSLSTLPHGNGAIYDENQKLDMNSWENPYDFLTDGARAVRAFSRPWPAAIIGVPIDFNFDIAKAEFKLTVLVSPEDAPRPRDDVSLSAASADKEEELATEIYVPLVQYARDEYVPREQQQQDQDDEIAKSRGCSSCGEVMGDTPPDGSPRNASTINLSNLLPSHIHTSGDGTTSSSLNALHSRILDICVEVSEGRWEADGQTVKWWYPVPKEGESSKEYTIEIRRNGGVIKNSYTESETILGSWYETLCPGGCCLM